MHTTVKYNEKIHKKEKWNEKHRKKIQNNKKWNTFQNNDILKICTLSVISYNVVSSLQYIIGPIIKQISLYNCWKCWNNGWIKDFKRNRVFFTSIPGKGVTSDPVAIRMFFVDTDWLVPSGFFTATSLALTIVAIPWICSTCIKTQLRMTATQMVEMDKTDKEEI